MAKHVALDGLTLQVNRGELFRALGPMAVARTTFFKLHTTLLSRNPDVWQCLIKNCRSSLHKCPSAGRRLPKPELRSETNRAREPLLPGSPVWFAGFPARCTHPTSRRRIGVHRSTGLDARKAIWWFAKTRRHRQSMLHAPRLLILDEPSTGLDPAARLDLWHALVATARSVRCYHRHDHAFAGRS